MREMRFLTELPGRLVANRSVLRLALLAIALVLFFSLMSESFFTVLSFQSMGFTVAEIGLISLAMMLSMLTGGIDLSAVSIANLSALVAAWVFASTGVVGSGGLILLAVGAAVLTGMLLGAFNGLLITKIGITPILATLGTMTLFNGIAVVWTGGKVVYSFPVEFLNIGTGKMLGIPIPFLVLMLAGIGCAVFVNSTSLGARLKLVGANLVAAKYSGLKNNRVLVSTYLASGMLSALAGLVIAAKSNSASADYGASYVLLAIVIVVLGGVNPNGGFGTVGGVLLSACVLQVLYSGFNQLQLNQFLYVIAQGGILIGVLALGELRFDRLRARRQHIRDRRASETGPSGADPSDVKETSS